MQLKIVLLKVVAQAGTAADTAVIVVSVAHQVAGATVVAEDAARVLAVQRDLLKGKLAADAQFAANFYRAVAIFLADRLRTTTSRLGYGKADQDAFSQSVDELSDDLMETVSLGTRRFNNLLQRVG